MTAAATRPLPPRAPRYCYPEWSEGRDPGCAPRQASAFFDRHIVGGERNRADCLSTPEIGEPLVVVETGGDASVERQRNTRGRRFVRECLDGNGSRKQVARIEQTGTCGRVDDILDGRIRCELFPEVAGFRLPTELDV